MPRQRTRNRQKDADVVYNTASVSRARGASQGNVSHEEIEQSDERFISGINEFKTLPEQGAFRHRLDPANPCADEENEFSFLRNNSNPAHRKMYLSSRNFILSEWVKNCKTQLTYKDVHAALFSNGLAYTKEQNSLSFKAYGFLERYGYINSGKFDVVEPKPKCNKKVLVIGAGISGIACARQLDYFGFDVTVIEARERVGGRIQTFKKGSYVADLGAMIVTGLGGNPFSILARQFNIPYRRINNECKLYDHSGEVIDEFKDEVMEQEFNRLLAASKYASSQLGFTETCPGRPVSLGQTIELIIMHQEQLVLKKTEKFYRNLVNLQTEIRDQAKQAQTLYSRIEYEKSLVKQLENKRGRNVKEEFQFKSAVFNVNDFAQQYENSMKSIKILQEKFAEMKKEVPVDTYMSTQDRNILDWHAANLEFANSTPLNNVSLSHWDQDDVNEFPGDHYSIESGLGVIPDTLSEGLDIKFQTAVRNVDYNTSIVVVNTEDASKIPVCRREKPVGSSDSHSAVKSETGSSEGGERSFNADAVVVTVPLGVLKEDPPLITFKPELPEWKTQAIDRLGFGNLMKIVLCFDKRFWDTSTNMFGFVNSNYLSRGECFLFNSLWSAPVLVALVAGESNAIMDELDDETIVQKCLDKLSVVYKESMKNSQLKEKLVTRWRDDVFCGGAYSYVAIGATGDDYDLLAKPVSGLRSGKNNLFFAGEHTMRNYPATAHGAYLSGLNAASQVADQLLGVVDSAYAQP